MPQDLYTTFLEVKEEISTTIFSPQFVITAATIICIGMGLIPLPHFLANISQNIIAFNTYPVLYIIETLPFLLWLPIAFLLHRRNSAGLVLLTFNLSFFWVISVASLLNNINLIPSNHFELISTFPSSVCVIIIFYYLFYLSLLRKPGINAAFNIAPAVINTISISCLAYAVFMLGTMLYLINYYALS